MNLRLPLLSAALVSLLLSSPTSAATAELFHESFDSNTQSWSGSGNKDSFGSPDNAGWSISVGNVYPGQKGLRLGTAGVLGGAKSPSFDLSNRTENVTIRVVAAAHQTASGTQTLHVNVLNSSLETNKAFSATLTKISSDQEIPETDNYVKTFSLLATDLPAVGTISLELYGESSRVDQRRVLIGDILVTQTIVSGLTPLDAPTGLLASNNDYTSFSLSWNSVANAAGYTVTVKNANNEVVGTPVVNGTSATVTGLASGGTYTAYVIALGDGTTHDDSEPASLSNIQTTAPTVLDTPTGLASSNIGYFGFNLSWTAVSDATGYTVTLSPAAGTVEVSGTTAMATGLAEGATYTASVVAKGNGTTTVDSTAATLSVTTATAPAIAQPDPTASAVSSSSVTVSWTAQNDASFSVRAWTLIPADIAMEDFAGFAADGTVPEGWTFDHAEAYTGSTYAHYPVGFKSVSGSAVSPDFGGTISSLSFQLRSLSAEGSFIVSAAPHGTDNWTVVTNYTSAANTLKTEAKNILLDTEAGYSKIKFEFVRTGGSAAFGSLVVVGTDVGKQPSYLTGYGPTAAAAGATSITISNPVAGETNYVEVTATGLSGRTATSVLPVAVPARPAVISVK